MILSDENIDRFSVKTSLSVVYNNIAPLEDMFYIIGLGLSDEKDITLRGLEVLIVPCTNF